jgi:alpha-L-rhamnosidase
VYRHYGDTAIIDRNWSAMERWIKFVLDSNPDFIWRHNRGSDWGDWLAVDAKQPGDETTSKALIGTAFWAHSTALMAQMAKATARLGDSVYYQQLHEKIAAAFQKEFVRPDGKVGNGSQTSHILPLAFGLIPEELRGRVAEELVSDIRARGTKLSTGFLGTPYILDALATNGHEDVAVDLLLQTNYPSWGYMVMKGATTMWERWNSDSGALSMNSYNHYAFGAISAFLYRRLAGIDQDRPGFEGVVIRPICDGRLKFAAADYDSVHGRISTEWRRDGRRLTLSIAIPPNVNAAIHIPASANQTIREGKYVLGAKGGIPVASRDSRRAIVLVGSGRYRFFVA